MPLPNKQSFVTNTASNNTIWVSANLNYSIRQFIENNPGCTTQEIIDAFPYNDPVEVYRALNDVVTDSDFAVKNT